MRSSVVFCLAVSFAMFGFGLSLQCYSCPDGTSSNCEVQMECNESEDSCLKLTSGDQTYTRCFSMADCEFTTLAVRYAALPKFKFSCCQSNLCNVAKKSFAEKIKWWFG